MVLCFVQIVLKQRNILKNRPEQFMRDQLCQYLTENMRYTFTTEPELGQTKKELDIYLLREGRYVPQLPLFAGDIVAPEKFPQLQIDLTTIF